MARFYGMIQGNRGAATRLGSDTMFGQIQGWDLGMMASISKSSEGEDVLIIKLTRGSNRPSTVATLGVFKIGSNDKIQRIGGEKWTE